MKKLSKNRIPSPEIEYGLRQFQEALSEVAPRNCPRRGFVLTGGFFLSYYVTKVTNSLRWQLRE
jgi:hypothetical protein